jgi:hypothetical protein
MFVVALASLIFGYALLYYAVDAMSHYKSASKTTTGIPFGVALGLPPSGTDTAMVFATWGSDGSAAPASNTTTPTTNGSVQAV